MKLLLFNLFYWLMFVLVTLLAAPVFPLAILIYVLSGRKPDWAVRRLILFYGRILVRMISLWVPVRLEKWSSQMPVPAIWVANHNSSIDPYVFAVMGGDIGFLSSWAFKLPIYGFWMRQARYVNATEGWETLSRQCSALLQEGTSVLIWPEGHRSRDGRMGRFKNGAFALAVQTGYPLIPFCLIGTGQFLPPGRLWVCPSPIKLVMLDPVYPDLQNDPDHEIIRLKKAVREVISHTLQQEENAGGVSRPAPLKEVKNADSHQKYL